MLVSVVIPVYNAAKYVGEAIECVLQQTYKKVEIIVIDDGSTDNTQTFVTKNYPQVVYHQIPHCGVSGARNFGITHSRGDYIAFLDADDKWLPEKLEKQYLCFKMNPSLGMVFTEEAIFNENGIIVNKCHKKDRLMQGDIVKNIFLRSFVGTSSVMVNKEVFSRVGLFNKKLTIGEDDNMWIRIASQYPVQLIDESFMLYRISAGSLTHNKRSFCREVYKSVRILQKDSPEIAERLGKKTINIKFASIFFSEGYSCFSQKNYSKAHKYFLKSLFHNPINERCIMLMILTLFSSGWISKLLSLKKAMQLLTSK